MKAKAMKKMGAVDLEKEREKKKGNGQQERIKVSK
jgi:hypothetical protein